MPTYPLPTLAATITPTGITAPAYADIINSLVATMQSIFGSDIYLTPDTQDYQLLAIFALAINDANQTCIAVYNAFNPTYAQGAELSSLVKLNNIRRKVPSNSTANVLIVGVTGTTIINGIVQDVFGNLWNLPANVVIPDAGQILVTATCELAGAIAADVNTITTIYTPVYGWQTATNPAIAVPGLPVETDAALRQRQTISPGLLATSPLLSILSNVANIEGVGRYTIYENDTSTTDDNGIPGHSISVVVEGGDVTTIAETIEVNKNPGTGTYGTTSIGVVDPAGLPITINFFELEEVDVFVNITIQPLAGYVSATGTELVNNLVSFINDLPIGEDVYLSWMYGVAGLMGNALLSNTFVVTSLTIGTSLEDMGTANIPVAFNQAANTVNANIALTVS